MCKIFLNTYGDKHRIGRELANFMDYMNGSEPNDDFTRRLQAEVELQRDDDGRRMLYMTYSRLYWKWKLRGLNKVLSRALNKALNRVLNRGLKLAC